MKFQKPVHAGFANRASAASTASIYTIANFFLGCIVYPFVASLANFAITFFALSVG